VVGLLGVTAHNLAESSLSHWAYGLIIAAALLLALRTKVHPILILRGGAAVRAGIGVLTGH
jgi:hypothetical protein